MDLTLGSLSGNYHDCRPLYVGVYDEDSNSQEHVVICARGSIVQVVSSLTGSLIGTFTGHRNAGFVTCIAQFSSDTIGSMGIEIVSVSNDGMICIWDLKQCKASTEFYLEGFSGTIYDIFPVSQSRSSVNDFFVTIDSGFFPGRDKLSKRYPYQTAAVDLKSKQLTSRGAAYLEYSRNCVDFLCFENFAIDGQVKQQETQILVVGSKRKIIFFNARDTLAEREIYTYSKENVTCLTTNSVTGAVVTGHADGMILIWHRIKDHLQEVGFFGSSNGGIKKRKLSKEERSRGTRQGGGAQPFSTALHWHAHAVCSVALSFDGKNLFSGGEEAVLVMWHHIPSSTSSSTSSATSRSFIPRLGGGIAHVVSNRDPVSTDSSVSLDCSKPNIVVTTLDNSIRVVNTVSLKVEWVLRSICVVARKNSI
jgi:hypothetical protein